MHRSLHHRSVPSLESGVRGVIVALSLSVLIAPTGAGGTPPTEEWAALWNGPGNHDDTGAHVVIDGDDVYVSGITYELGPDGNREDFSLLKYDLDGNLQWSRRYGGPGLEDPSAMLLAAPGMVVLTGLAWEEAPDVLTLAYDADGEILWEGRAPVAGEIHPFLPPALTQDAEGNLLVVAHDDGDFLILKYALDGSLLWRRTYDAPGDGLDAARSVATDAAGSVYVSGRINWSQGYATIKLDADGIFQWEQIEDGDIGSTFDFVEVGVGPDGDPVVVGNPESTCGVFETRVWKCDAATGEPLWVWSYPTDPCRSIEPVDMEIDAAGNVIVTGFGNAGTPSAIRFQTLRHGPDGELHWIREFDGSGSSSDIAAALAIDAAGNVYVTGHTTHPPQDRDFATVSYTPAGDERWRMEWGGPWGTNDGALDIVVSDAGDVIVSGFAYNPEQQEDAVTIRYRQEPTVGVIGAPPVIVRELLRPSPTPTRGATTVRYEVPRPGEVRLTVLDVTGRLVRDLRSRTLPAGVHRIRWDGTDDAGRAVAAGTYFVRMEAPGVTDATRVEIVR